MLRRYRPRVRVRVRVRVGIRIGVGGIGVGIGVGVGIRVRIRVFCGLKGLTQAVSQRRTLSTPHLICLLCTAAKQKRGEAEGNQNRRSHDKLQEERRAYRSIEGHMPIICRKSSPTQATDGSQE